MLRLTRSLRRVSEIWFNTRISDVRNWIGLKREFFEAFPPKKNLTKNLIDAALLNSIWNRMERNQKRVFSMEGVSHLKLDYNSGVRSGEIHSKSRFQMIDLFQYEETLVQFGNRPISAYCSLFISHFLFLAFHFSISFYFSLSHPLGPPSLSLVCFLLQQI